MNILITGASTGIGRVTAETLAKKGHRVWAGVRSEKVFREIQSLNIPTLIPVLLDVTISKSIEKAIDQVKNQCEGKLEALINNAGIVVSGPVEVVPVDEWRRQFEVNFFGQIAVIQSALPFLRDTRGRVINVSSISGRISMPWMVPYSASKFALCALSDGLRRELHKYGIFVASIEPGPIDTPIWDKSLAAGEKEMMSYDQKKLDLYRSDLEVFQAHAKRSRDRASPVEHVVKAIEHALFSSSPKTRYPVGKGISVAALLARALPDKVLDWVVRKLA